MAKSPFGVGGAEKRICATTRIGREIFCLLYAGFFNFPLNKIIKKYTKKMIYGLSLILWNYPHVMINISSSQPSTIKKHDVGCLVFLNISP